jgi:hypothetical protein
MHVFGIDLDIKRMLILAVAVCLLILLAYALAQVLGGDGEERNLPPHIEPVPSIVVKPGGEGSIDIEAKDPNDDDLTTQLDGTAPSWVELDGFKLTARPGVAVDTGTYMVKVYINDTHDLSSVASVPVIVTAEDTDEEETNWPLCAAFLFLALVLMAVIVIEVSN